MDNNKEKLFTDLQRRQLTRGLYPVQDRRNERIFDHFSHSAMKCI